jgi:hypothetical protein
VVVAVTLSGAEEVRANEVEPWSGDVIGGDTSTPTSLGGHA